MCAACGVGKLDAERLLGDAHGMPGATEDQLNGAEAVLGIRLPPELRLSLSTEDGSEALFGDCYLVRYSVAELVAVNQEIDRHPGFLAFASDGSRELIGLDLRRDPPPVVMIDIVSPGWETSLFEAATLADFMQQRSEGVDLRWDVPYEAAP